MQYYNIHTHIFTMENAPRHFLDLYMPKVAARAVDIITSTEAGSHTVAWLLNTFGGPGWKRYASFLRIGKSASQLEVFRDLLDQYDDKTMKFVALTMHMEALGAGASDSGYEGQLEQALAVKRRYPDRLLLFLGVDPRWKGGGEALQRTVQAYFEHPLSIRAGETVPPFAGLKLYPSTGFYAFDPRLKPTLEWAARTGVPVISHCNYLGGIYNNDGSYIRGNLRSKDPYTGQDYGPVSIGPKVTNLEACSWFLEPESYRGLLQYFSGQTGAWDGPPLKLCLAHYGGDKHILHEQALVTGSPLPDKAGPYFGENGENWCGQIKELMRQFQGLYTDISYALWNDKIHPAVFRDLKDPALSGRILYGTDFFLTERELPEVETYGRFKKAALQPENMVGGVSAWEALAGKNPEAFLL